MPFEQNQQDGFNLGNSFDQVKRLTAEASNSAAAIAAAELAAEEEQQALRLKNLAIQQKLRIEQIKKQIELEEKSLLELEELRRTCSERQYEARKREIQKELEAAKKAEEELFKTKNKHKKQQANASTQDTPATTASKSNAAQSKKSYTDGSGSGLAKVDLGISFKEVTDRFEAYIAANENVNASVQNAFDNIIKSDSSGTTLELAKDLLESVEEFEKETQKIQEFNNNRKHNIELIQSAEKHKLATQHAKAEHDNEIAASIAKARYEEFIAKKDLYAAEYRFAREKEFYDYQKQQAEELAKLESDIAWNSEHRNELLAQENQKAHKDYLREYLALQADEYSKLTENMSALEFAKMRAETEAAEKAIAARGKANAAFDKAFAAQKGKGTAAEKKTLIDAIVAARAAEKDWSSTKYKITDDMSDDEKAEIHRKRENAVKAEMAMNAAMNAMANLAQQLMSQTDKIGDKQAPIDTRLQGSTVNDKNLGSYWKQLSRDMNKLGAVNPFFRQEDFANNIEALVNRGISFDIKQRAFLMTIQEKIANTFDVADGTLLRLIRIQQQDTTAGRLGMESALNSFLNSMYETSEYLTDVAASVRGSLEEMQALMEGAAGTELEFQVQKWMGSLYSVGMSQEAVQSIAQTFGQIASGDVSGLTGNGTGNLLIMAANEAGKSIADILQDGLDAKETNELMQAMVNYLAEIAETSSDSRVVQQQLANVYGMKASDLRAATNLASSIKDVSKQDLTYGGMIGQLEDMAKSMILRTSTGEFLSNIWSNTQYTMATQMSNDPVLYLLPKVATLLEDYAGGIDLPFLNVMGFGVDLNTSVAQLMNVAAMSGSILGALGPMMSGLATAVSGSGNLLRLAGIDTKNSKVPVIARGTVSSLQNLGGQGLSESGYVGNASGDDVKNATLQDAEDSKKKQMVEAKEEESSDDVVIRSQQAVIDIYNLLEEVAHGSQSLRVKVINANNGFGGGVVQNTIGGGDENSTGNPIHSGTDNGNWVFS